MDGVNKKDVIKAFEQCICNKNQYCSKCYQEGPSLGFVCRKNVCLEVLRILKEQESTLGLHIDSSGIHMLSTGDASQGERRGLLLGKAMMHEYIEKELLYKGLLTDEIRQVLDSVKRELI